jgi:bisphosphoglycerate-dependent phosphoglycerate mutase
MHLDRLTKEQVLALNIPTGAPIVYEIDARGRVLGKVEHQFPAATGGARSSTGG